MSLLLSKPSKLCLGKPAFSNGFGNHRSLMDSKTSVLSLDRPSICPRKLVLVRSSPPVSDCPQTPPCAIIDADPCGKDMGKLNILNVNECSVSILEKKVPLKLLRNHIDDGVETIGASYGWVATLKDGGSLCLQDDLDPAASDKDPKRIPLPPLVTLPRCQTQIITNVSMSTSSPEDEDCIVAIKFLGPQLSLCRPAQPNAEWTNFRIENPCFSSSRVMFSKKDDMFCIPGSGGHLIGSWDLRRDTPKIQKLRFVNLPELTKKKRELLESCRVSFHLVESRCTDETFLVKWYRKTRQFRDRERMKTEFLMVFKLDDEGNAVFTRDMGDLSMFISKSEPFCVRASSYPGLHPNMVELLDVDGYLVVHLTSNNIFAYHSTFEAPYHISPQNI